MASGPMGRFSEKIGRVPDNHKEKAIDKHDHEGIGGWTEHLQAPLFYRTKFDPPANPEGWAACPMLRISASWIYDPGHRILRRGRERGSRPDPREGSGRAARATASRRRSSRLAIQKFWGKMEVENLKETVRFDRERRQEDFTEGQSLEHPERFSPKRAPNRLKTLSSGPS